MVVSDADSIARVLERDDRHAFGELVRRYQAPVRSFLRRLCGGDDAHADDLSQDTFLRAYRGLKGYRGGAKLSSWLYRIAYNVFLTALARQRPPADELSSDLCDPGPTPAHTVSLQLDLTRAMAFLRPEERAALALAYGAEVTHEEIAEALQCPLGTVKSNIARGKDELRRRLRHWQEGVHS